MENNKKFHSAGNTPASPASSGVFISACGVRFSFLHGYAKVMAGHLFGLRDAEEAEERGRDVLQRAAGTKREVLVVGGDSDQRYGVQCMRGVGAAGHGIDHHL